MRGRLWVERDGETWLSWARVELLSRVEASGSISAAARELGMGYRHAWALIDDVTTKSPRPLVQRVSGGARGGGTRLRAEGQALVARFRALQEAFRA